MGHCHLDPFLVRAEDGKSGGHSRLGHDRTGRIHRPGRRLHSLPYGARRSGLCRRAGVADFDGHNLLHQYHPDAETCIGRYDYGDFERAVRQGMRPDGAHLYPAMPYASYRVVSDADIQALYAYFMSSVAPVTKENQPTTIPWPADLRWPLAW